MIIPINYYKNHSIKSNSKYIYIYFKGHSKCMVVFAYYFQKIIKNENLICNTIVHSGKFVWHVKLYFVFGILIRKFKKSCQYKAQEPKIYLSTDFILRLCLPHRIHHLKQR